MSKRKQLARTDTVALDSQEDTFEEPPPKRQRTKGPKREKIAYSTTTVLRSLDGEGETATAPLMSSLRSASFHTRKVLQQQLKNEKKTQTPELLLARRVLSMLNKNFKEIKGYKYEPNKPSHKWSSKQAIKDFQKEMEPLTNATTNLLKKDKMIVSLKSPTYVLGDLHGNYKDLMFFRQSFWSMGMDMSPARFLFLGDYVDRGPHSVELIAYLFALKIVHPDKVFLLRGNHEFPAQNGERDYDPCFLQNCEELFPVTAAKKIWQQYNDAFDWMPIGATIDKKIFCCHGGIPRIVQNDDLGDNTLFSLINEIERPLKEDEVDETEDFIALDILWSDPATEEEEKETEGPGWFGENDRGGDIVVFGKKAVEAFIKKTGCTHIIRAHQPPSRGIEYCKGARILTVFSSSHYCGGFNSAAIVLINEGRIRVATTNPADEEEQPESEEEEGEDLIAEEDYTSE